MAKRKISDKRAGYELHKFSIQADELHNFKEYAISQGFDSLSDLIRRSVRFCINEGFTARSSMDLEYRDGHDIPIRKRAESLRSIKWEGGE